MKYILSPNIALRSWRLVPYAFFVKGCNFATGLKKEEFELLLSCDGQTDLPLSDLLLSLAQRGLIRLIRTTPAPRWEQNAAGQTFDIGEYYDLALETTKNYTAKPRHADLVIWQAIELYPQEKAYHLKPVKETPVKFRESLPICSSVRGMVAVGANGNVYPCLQMSGWFDGHGIVLGNVKRDGLAAILTESGYLAFTCQTVKDRITHNGKCGRCPYLKYCFGGCPALAILGSEEGDPLAPDPFKCFFYENGYYDKFVSALPGWANLTVME